MNPSFTAILIMLVLITIIMNDNKRRAAARRIITSDKKEIRIKMKDMANKFIGKECIVYTLNSQLTGTVKEVGEGALLLETKDSTEAVNFDYILRLREYPRNKNGKKKSLVV